MLLPFFFPAELFHSNCGSGRDEEPSGEEAVLRQIRIRLATLSLQGISRARQANLARARIADSSSRHALSFSSACTTKRFPSSQGASTSKLFTFHDPRLTPSPNQPRFLRLSAIISQ